MSGVYIYAHFFIYHTVSPHHWDINYSHQMISTTDMGWLGYLLWPHLRDYTFNGLSQIFSYLI